MTRKVDVIVVGVRNAVLGGAPLAADRKIRGWPLNYGDLAKVGFDREK